MVFDMTVVVLRQVPGLMVQKTVDRPPLQCQAGAGLSCRRLGAPSARDIHGALAIQAPRKRVFFQVIRVCRESKATVSEWKVRSLFKGGYARSRLKLVIARVPLDSFSCHILYLSRATKRVIERTMCSSGFLALPRQFSILSASVLGTPIGLQSTTFLCRAEGGFL